MEILGFGGRRSRKQGLSLRGEKIKEARVEFEGEKISSVSEFVK